MHPKSFETHPSRYQHWKVRYEGPVAHLVMDVNEAAPLVPGYALKLNSYDLGVDIELADFVQRLRFEHPEVKVVVVSSGKEKVFCAGANIRMLAGSSHPFKVNFCKYTNETRLYIEDMSRSSGVKWLAALAGTCAGGGYELALACDEIGLVDDGSSAVSLPEVPLLGVLPGTGGLTRVVDKRKVRRDRADVFATVSEGIKGKRAADWRLVDWVAPRSKFPETVAARRKALVDANPAQPDRAPVVLPTLDPKIDGDKVSYSHVELSFDRSRRTADLLVRAPSDAGPRDLAGIHAAWAQWWPLKAFRELDDALLRLRFHGEEINVVTLRTAGDAKHVLEMDAQLEAHEEDGFVREVLLHMARTLRRLDLTARSFFAVVDKQSAFAGSLLELAMAADRTYVLDADGVSMTLSWLNFGTFPMSHGLTRLQQRLDDAAPDDLEAEEKVVDREIELNQRRGLALGASAADAAGLVTVLSDELDFEDDLRVALEERASLSPDALTGMEASLRFAGPETPETKIFGRLSAWQNWIFTRPNSTGPTGALTRYGQPEKPQFDFRRT